MSIVYNYYWSLTDPARPLTRKSPGNALALVPDNATRVVPPEYAKGTIPCWNGVEWVVRADWRQETVYDIKTGLVATYPTVDVDETYFKAHFTTSRPGSDYDRWNGTRWVFDIEKCRQAKIKVLVKQRKEAIKEAGEEILVIQDAIECLTDLHQDTTRFDTLLTEWKKYRGQAVILTIRTGEETLPTAPVSVRKMYG